MALSKEEKSEVFTERTHAGTFVAEHKGELYFVDENLLEDYHHYERGDNHDGWFAEHDDPDEVCEFDPKTDGNREDYVPWGF